LQQLPNPPEKGGHNISKKERWGGRELTPRVTIASLEEPFAAEVSQQQRRKKTSTNRKEKHDSYEVKKASVDQTKKRREILTVGSHLEARCERGCGEGQYFKKSILSPSSKKGGEALKEKE